MAKKVVKWYGAQWLAFLLACGARSFDAGNEGTDTSGSTSTGSSDGGTHADTATGESTSEPGGTTEPGSTSGPYWCSEHTYAIRFPPVILAFVAERSLHMATTWDHDADPATADVTRWQGVHDAVSAVIDARCTRDIFGLWLYPSEEATNTHGEPRCRASDWPEVALEPENGEPVLDALPPPTAGSDDLVGGSPARVTYEDSITHVLALDLDFEAIVMLLAHLPPQCADGSGTDGGLMEIYDDAILDSVAQAHDELGIHTVVVGIDIEEEATPGAGDGIPDGVSPPQVFNDIAIAGGMQRAGEQKFYGATDLAELSDVLACEPTGCVLELDPPPAGMVPSLTELRLEDVEIPRVEDCATENGWTYVYPGGPHEIVELCGQACEDFRTLADSTIYTDALHIVLTYYCE